MKKTALKRYDVYSINWESLCYIRIQKSMVMSEKCTFW